MNKLYLLCALFFMTQNVFAGVCSNGTVSVSVYSYNFMIIGGSSGQNPSIYQAGRITFLSGGAMSVSGTESRGGETTNIAVNGTYSVSSVCVLTMKYILPPTSSLTTERTFFVTVYLDRLYTSLATNIAYHGNAIFKTSNSLSGTGVIDRVTGKF